MVAETYVHTLNRPHPRGANMEGNSHGVGGLGRGAQFKPWVDFLSSFLAPLICCLGPLCLWGP